MFFEDAYDAFAPEQVVKLVQYTNTTTGGGGNGRTC